MQEVVINTAKIYCPSPWFHEKNAVLLGLKHKCSDV